MKKPATDPRETALLCVRYALDKKAYDLLGKLEHSHHHKDRQVLNHFKKSDKHDPGSGSRRGGDEF